MYKNTVIYLMSILTIIESLPEIACEVDLRSKSLVEGSNNKRVLKHQLWC